MVNRMNIGGVCCAAMMLALSLGACQFKGGLRGDGAGGNSAVWRIEPTSMRVYPSSRFAQEAGLTLLEARIEMRDVMGDSMKAVGVYRFELFTGDRLSEATQGKRLYSWDVSLRTLEEQRRHYDPITRTYLFRLRIDERVTPDRGTVLVVTFMPMAGERLEAQGALGG